MKFNRYTNAEVFCAHVLDILLEDEVYNNLIISIIAGGLPDRSSASGNDWLMGTITNEDGEIMLITQCTKPFNILLYAPHGIARNRCDESLYMLAKEIKSINFAPPGVFAEAELARSFVKALIGNTIGVNSIPMVLMKLEKLSPCNDAPGWHRMLTEDDLTYVPFWEQAFCNDCHIPVFTLEENIKRIRTRIGKDIHYIWEDGVPVSQAVFGRETPNGAVVNWVYTPPLYRGHGYATAVVSKLSQSLLAQGKQFCCLFAESANMTSRGIYSKLGYYDVCEFEQIKFE